MKRPRAVTPEEMRQWREANRFTTKRPEITEEDIEAMEAEEIAAPKASPKPVAMKATTKQNLSPLKQLSIREASRSFKPHKDVEATLDLHGMTKLEAYDMVQQFIRKAQRAGKRHVAIITGKGKGGEVGVLRSNLPHWLNEPTLRPLISAVAEARAEKGGAGVMHVLVKKP